MGETDYLDGRTSQAPNQTKLPTEILEHECRDYQSVAEAIRTMIVRERRPSEPVLPMVLGAFEFRDRPRDEFVTGMKQVADTLAETRPTAVNLFWALRRMLQVIDSHPEAEVEELVQRLTAEADAIAREDEETCRRIGDNGASLIKDGDGVLTHCNAGALATVDYGTALGVIRSAHRQGKKIHVYVDETRPYLQGARLTAWEMVQEQIPATLITDSMAGWMMQQGRIQAAVVGADRIAANGDTANKIGTYTVAVLCKEHGIPFYVAAPLSTIDLDIDSGQEIPIEERDPREITHFYDRRIAPEGIR